LHSLPQIIKFARLSGLQEEVGPVVRGKTGDWIKEWELSKSDACALSVEVSSLLKTLKVWMMPQVAEFSSPSPV
jgi:hypothetical protein